MLLFCSYVTLVVPHTTVQSLPELQQIFLPFFCLHIQFHDFSINIHQNQFDELAESKLFFSSYQGLLTFIFYQKEIKTTHKRKVKRKAKLCQVSNFFILRFPCLSSYHRLTRWMKVKNLASKWERLTILVLVDFF